jgi:D-alanyl-D-alanine carboxypeptidase
MGEGRRRSVGVDIRTVALGLLVALLAGLGWWDAVPAHGAALEPAAAEALQQELRELRRDLREPGLSLAVRLPDGTIWTAVSGHAAIEKNHKRPVSPSTAFVAGSITKTFIGALVMQLVERGVIHLDDPVSTWMPGYPNASHLLVSQLLQHRSGLYDYFVNADYNRAVFGHPHHRWTVAEILALVRDPWFPPGTGWRYSNTNYILLGVILQRATHVGIGRLLRRRLLTRLDLAHTVFQNRPPSLRDLANGYLWSNDGWIGWDDGSSYRPNPSAATVAWTAGAMLATPTDLVRWAHALYAENRVVNAASRVAMTTFNKHDYGFATERFFTTNRPETQEPMWGHSGSLRGFEAQLWYVPSRDLTIALMGNRGRVSLRPAVRRLLRVLLRSA